MTSKRIKLPKEGFVGADEPTTGTRLEDDDVEGHSFATPAPPSISIGLTPTHGGEFTRSRGGENTPSDDEDDWKGLNDR
jgi:hypothetical protein